MAVGKEEEGLVQTRKNRGWLLMDFLAKSMVSSGAKGLWKEGEEREEEGLCRLLYFQSIFDSNLWQ